MKLEITKSETLTSFMVANGGSLNVIENPKKKGSFFFQAGAQYGAISSKLDVESIDYSKPNNYQICWTREAGKPDAEQVPFLCAASTANVKGTFSL